MSQEGIYNIDFDICSVLLCVLVLVYLILRRDMRIIGNRMFLIVVIFMLLCSFSGSVMDVIRNGGIACSSCVAEVFTFISHFAHNSIPFLLTLYFLIITGIWHGVSKRMIAVLSIPEILLLTVHLVPSLRHMLYYYTDDCVYVRGPMYDFYYVIIAVYVAASVIILSRHFSAIRKKDRIYIIVIGAGFLGGMVSGFIDEYARMTDFLQTLFLGGGFFALEHDEGMIDMESGLHNTQALIKDAHPLFDARYTSQVIAVKLQHFNYYRLILGADACIDILRQIGRWMNGMESESVKFYRISQGRFAAVLLNHDEKDAENEAEILRRRFAKPWHYSGSHASIVIPAQIWVSSVPDRISTDEQMLVFAEASFDDSLPKDRIYVADEIREDTRRVKVDIAVRRALAEDTLEIWYQPIYNTESRKIHSCEALVRMHDPELGYVSPDEFIRVAEQTGTISQIGDVVFEKVCRFIAERDPSQYGIEFVGVNLSTIQCMDEGIVDRMKAAVEKYGVSAEHIILEITESAVIHNEDMMQKIVGKLKKAGFSFALDDFGTGNANYSYILKYPFRVIKIDKRFLWSAEKSESNRIILNSMLQMVRDLKLRAVVEGVENQDQKEKLIDAGASYLQGFCFSKPVPEGQFIDYIRKFNGQGEEASC